MKVAIRQKNMWIGILKFVFLVLVVFWVQSVIVNAQSTDTVSISYTPNNPSAYEEVVVRLQSSVVDLGRSDISWYLNDGLRLSGVGESRARFTTGAYGVLVNIRIVIISPEGQRIVRNFTVQPEEVDIVWEAFSYTPPYYKGKALSPSMGLVLITAMPQLADSGGNLVDPAKLIYTWKESGVALGNSSGVGKQQIILRGKALSSEPLIVNLSVSTSDGKLVANKTIAIPVHSPSISFYEKRPLEGINYEREIDDSFELIEDEVVFRAEPYFFSLDDFTNAFLKYKWRMNSIEIDVESGRGNEVTFRREENVSGKVRISLNIENNNIPFRVLQSAVKSVLINIK